MNSETLDRLTRASINFGRFCENAVRLRDAGLSTLARIWAEQARHEYRLMKALKAELTAA